MKLLSAFQYLSFLFIFAAMSCNEVIQDPTGKEILLDRTFTVGQESTFQINQRYTSSDDKYTLKINSISDSRCPVGARCIWQGEVTIKGEWTDHDTKSNFEVHSVLQNSTKQPEGFTIQIIDAKPYPVYTDIINPDDIVVTLLVQKNNEKLDTLSFVHSSKGYELYSWPVGNAWKYSILLGTNRVKFYDEIMTNKITVLGKDSLKMLIDKFPKNEYIFWQAKLRGDEGRNISLPDQNTVNEIKNYASQKELNFNVVE